ncbi:sugar ABC transporter ATP-binding protein [Uliginosibacterium gangwonense]|uniref:sugar ABC transporter ATP-binding protein n=1 Tax=Uliginosibacterium gangwonense TaxID=392736 RepID=UPI00035CA619|nr:sugar ABC transporter ATP-binding protein [Uliginosibacterium gangwonense]
MTEQQAILQMQGIHKRFPGVVALKDVSLRLFPGEVHALMGQNGAGKSTLIKVLTGVENADSGDITLAGKAIRVTSVLEAQELGISTVYQEVNLCSNLSVAENIFIGRFPFRFGRIDWKTMNAKARTALAALNIDIDVSLPLSSYPVAIQQMVAIARALGTEAQVLILDEPTSSLDEDEVERLFDALRKLKAKGIAILFVTHFLDQTYAISDRITVLRNGELEGEYLAADLPRIQLINKMVGREIDESSFARQTESGEAKASAGEPFLAARNLGRAGTLRPLDLDVHAGQVLGLGGLLGSGRTETARLLFGIDHADSGSAKINGVPVSLNSPRKAIRQGLAFCPEDRKTEGIVAELSIRENIILALQAHRGIFRFLPLRKQTQIAEEYVKQLGIKTSDVEKPIGQLSGGNQQKALLARWLATEPKMLILDEPTRGIDVAAKLEIMDLVKTQCRKGLAILFISSEMSEVLRVSDRIAVLRDRQKIGELDGASADEQSIFRMIAGGES